MKKIFISLLFCGILASCATTDGSGNTSNSANNSNGLPYSNRVDFVGGRNASINIDHIITSNDNGYMKVQAVLSNSDSAIQQMYYRCIFFDNTGMLANNNVLWTPIQIFGQSNQYVACSSVDKGMVDYRIELSSSGDVVQLYK